MPPIAGHREARRDRALVILLAAACLVAVSGAASTGTSGATTAAPRPAAVTAGTVTITGSGFGHGVGMSQYGANGMASAGSTVAQILEHYYTGTTVVGYRDAVDVRVNVAHSARTLTLSSTSLGSGTGTVRLVPSSGSAASAVKGDTVALVPTTGGISATITRAGGTKASLTSPAFTVRWAGTRAMAGSATTLGVRSTLSNGTAKARSYRWGTLAVTRVGSFLEAVVVVDLHAEYLRGVAEMPSSWRPAALQAQAIAARNYALVAARTAPRASCGGCHLWDDTRSQVYTGWAKESEQVGSRRYGDAWVAAIAATQTSATTGLAVLYRGQPITAVYASSTGGRTRDAADVWGNAVPYLVSVADPWSTQVKINPNYARWTRSTTVARLRTLFGLTDLVTVAVTGRDRGGAAAVVTATSSDGTRRTMSGNAFTSKVGLPGAWITSLSLPGGTSTPPSPSASPPNSGSSPPSPSAPTQPGGSAPPSTLVPKGVSPVYWQPGVRTVNERLWSTRCEPYTATAHRCFTSIWATPYALVDGRWTTRPGWVLNNIAYFDSVPAAWKETVQATPGEHTSAGRQWRTTCEVAAGLRTCRTWILASKITRITTADGYRHVPQLRWRFNNVLYLTG